VGHPGPWPGPRRTRYGGPIGRPGQAARRVPGDVRLGAPRRGDRARARVHIPRGPGCKGIPRRDCLDAVVRAATSGAPVRCAATPASSLSGSSMRKPGPRWWKPAPSPTGRWDSRSLQRRDGCSLEPLAGVITERICRRARGRDHVCSMFARLSRSNPVGGGTTRHQDRPKLQRISAGSMKSQLVATGNRTEQRTLNPRVRGSSPWRRTR
jgi:hypothetical protein